MALTLGGTSGIVGAGITTLDASGLSVTGVVTTTALDSSSVQKFTINGNERLRITSNGKIGINTDSPSRLLHIDTTGSSTEGLVITSKDNTYPKLQLGANRNNADQFIGLIIASWDGTDVASIHFESGSDTTNKDDGLISFRTASAGTREERLRILSSGGITFNGDTATANALDDYEVGDWTPALSQGSPSYVTQKGLYTKIGELVLCSFYIDYTNGSSSTQRLTGLPFTPDTSRETITSVSRLGSAFNEDEGSGNRAMHSISHTSQGTTYVYVDLLINAAAKGLRGTFMYRAV